MNTVTKDDPCWSELLGLALYWSNRSAEARCFQNSRTCYINSLYSAPASKLLLIRREVDHLIIAAAGCRIACECLKVDFLLTDPEYALADNSWELHRTLFSKVASYAKQQKVSYIQFSMIESLQFLPLISLLAKSAKKTGTVTEAGIAQVQLLFEPSSLIAFAHASKS